MAFSHPDMRGYIRVDFGRNPPSGGGRKGLYMPYINWGYNTRPALTNTLMSEERQRSYSPDTDHITKRFIDVYDLVKLKSHSSASVACKRVSGLYMHYATASLCYPIVSLTRRI